MDSIKLALFDYDFTLFTHNLPDYYGRKELSYTDEAFLIMTKSDDIFECTEPVPCMQWYVDKMRKEGYKLFVLTHEIFNLRDSIKKDFVKKYYGDDLEYLTVDTPAHKVDMIRALVKRYSLEDKIIDDVVFVDDKDSTVFKVRQAGYSAYMLADIAVMYESAVIEDVKKVLDDKDADYYAAINRLRGTLCI